MTTNTDTDNAAAVVAALVGSRDPLISSQPSYPWTWNSYARAAETQAEAAPTYAERRALERAAALLWAEQEAEDRAEREALEEAEAAKTDEEREAERAEGAARLARHLKSDTLPNHGLLPPQARS